MEPFELDHRNNGPDTPVSGMMDVSAPTDSSKYLLLDRIEVLLKEVEVLKRKVLENGQKESHFGPSSGQKVRNRCSVYFMETTTTTSGRHSLT